MEERRLILAVTLSLAVLLVWQLVFKPPAPPPGKSPPTTQQPGTTTPQATSEIKPSLPPATGSTTPTTPPAQLVGGYLTTEEQAAPIDILVETDLYKCVLSSAGGYLKSFMLKDFKETAAKNSPLKELISSNLPPNDTPLSLSVNIGGKAIPPTATFAATLKEINLAKSASGASQSLQMTLKTKEGYEVQRTYKFTNGDYRVGLEIKLTGTPPSTTEAASAGVSNVVAVNWFTRMDVKQAKSRFGTFAAIAYTNKSFQKENPSKIQKKGSFTYDDVAWSGFADSYFMSVIIPQSVTAKAINSVEGEGENQIIAQRVEFKPGVLVPGQPQSYKMAAYLGPKEFTDLKALGEDLHLYNAVEYGRLEYFVRPLIWLLKLFNGLVYNWGLSVVLLTVFIKLIFYPLTVSSFKTMKKMQALQPRIKELQEKYKGDRAKVNEEMMALYRSQKVNPLGGCLPMLLQLPVLYGLYRALYVSIDLRYAPFMGWINDLSSPEKIFSLPFFGGVDVGVMPLLMGMSMYVQQKMTPTTMDPAQAKMFMMMPVMFTFISFGFPSGLVLYWTVSNLLTIAQQYVINRRGT